MIGGTSFRWASPLLVLLMLSVVVPAPVPADAAPVDLIMGGQGSVAWSMGSIQPGDAGTKDVELRNIGTSAAYLKLWISDIEETDARGDGAALSKYLRLELVADGLQTALDFPVLINQLPRYPSGSSQVTVGPIPPGGSVTTHWNWEFVDNGVPQNDAQGDGLSFTLNYLLAEVPPPGETYHFIIVDMLGRETVAGVNATGVVQQSVEAVDPDGVHRLSIPVGATVLTRGGLVPSHIVLVEVEGPYPGPPEGTTLVGPVFRLDGYIDNLAPAEVLISPQAGMSLGVASTDLPSGQEIVGIHALSATGTWSKLPGPAGALTSWEARGYIGGTGTYAVMARPEGSEPVAFLTARDMMVSPQLDQKWWPIVLFSNHGGSVTVSVIITNEGPIAASHVVTMFIDGRAADAQVVELGPGESRKVTFTASGLTDGEHEVRVAGQVERFRSVSTFEWPTLFIIVMALLIVILYLTRKDREPREIPDVVMADYKKRVLRELSKRSLSFSALAKFTSIEELKLIAVLEELWKEGMVGTRFRDGNLVYEGVFTMPNLKKKG